MKDQTQPSDFQSGYINQYASGEKEWHYGSFSHILFWTCLVRYFLIMIIRTVWSEIFAGDIYYDCDKIYWLPLKHRIQWHFPAPRFGSEATQCPSTDPWFHGKKTCEWDFCKTAITLVTEGSHGSGSPLILADAFTTSGKIARKHHQIWPYPRFF